MVLERAGRLLGRRQGALPVTAGAQFRVDHSGEIREHVVLVDQQQHSVHLFARIPHIHPVIIFYTPAY